MTIDPSRSEDFRIGFAYDSAELSVPATRELGLLGGLLGTDLRAWSYLIAGHTDAAGTLDYNVALSMRRAVAVRAHLIRRFAIAPRRLFAAGFGPTALRDPGRPLWAGNRRVEVVLVSSADDR